MTETSLLQGEITENPHDQEIDVEGLLLRFIRALVEEARPGSALSPSLMPTLATPRSRPAEPAKPEPAKTEPAALPANVVPVHPRGVPRSRKLSLVAPAQLTGDRT